MAKTKQTKGRPKKYDEETVCFNAYIPIGAREGIRQLIKEYLDIYMAKKKLDQLKKLKK